MWLPGVAIATLEGFAAAQIEDHPPSPQEIQDRRRLSLQTTSRLPGPRSTIDTGGVKS